MQRTLFAYCEARLDEADVLFRSRDAGEITGVVETVPTMRIPGSVAAALWGAAHGAHILRVHDVDKTVQALRVWQGLEGSV